MLAEPEEPTLHVVCADSETGGILFEKDVPRKLMMQSELIKNLIQDLGEESDFKIPLIYENIFSEKHFDHAMEYCAIITSPKFPHEERDQRTVTKERTITKEGEDVVTQYQEEEYPNIIELTEPEKDYMERIDVDLFEMQMLANYLDIGHLLEAVSFQIASSLHGKTEEEMREIFGVEDDLTPEEKAEIEKETELVENALK